MKEETRIQLNYLGRLVFHIGIPMAIVFKILNIWSEGVSNDATTEWNIFVTVACLGAACLVLLITLFVHIIAWMYKPKTMQS